MEDVLGCHFQAPLKREKKKIFIIKDNMLRLVDILVIANGDTTIMTKSTNPNKPKSASKEIDLFVIFGRHIRVFI